MQDPRALWFHLFMSIVKSKIRTIPDYPKPGILFRDIT
ncbi:MAG: adenine phosphoribosyltransferase, partial [Leptospira sp.]|nr:adenine phosphoribosyltransferase [Leptospira sp.]